MRIPLLLAAAAVLGLAAPVAQAAVRLPALVGSHMVLQRDRPVPVWAAPGEAVSVTFRGQVYPATAPDASGRWQATLPPTPAGGPYELTVQGQNILTLSDVLVGDVWLASGQSNMQFKVKDPNPAATSPRRTPSRRLPPPTGPASGSLPSIRPWPTAPRPRRRAPAGKCAAPPRWPAFRR